MGTVLYQCQCTSHATIENRLFGNFVLSEIFNFSYLPFYQDSSVEGIKSTVDSGKKVWGVYNKLYCLLSCACTDDDLLPPVLVNQNNPCSICCILLTFPGVQFHPESAGGPLDTMAMFDSFIDECRASKMILSGGSLGGIGGSDLVKEAPRMMEQSQ